MEVTLGVATGCAAGCAAAGVFARGKTAGGAGFTVPGVGLGDGIAITRGRTSGVGDGFCGAATCCATVSEGVAANSDSAKTMPTVIAENLFA